MHGPIAAMIRSRCAPSRSIASMVASVTPASAPFHPAWAAPTTPAAASAIYRAWLDHAVLVFRGQDLTQEDLIRVTGMFGDFAPLGRPAHTLPKGFTKILPNIMLISNIRENGETKGSRL